MLSGTYVVLVFTNTCYLLGIVPSSWNSILFFVFLYFWKYRYLHTVFNIHFSFYNDTLSPPLQKTKQKQNTHTQTQKPLKQWRFFVCWSIKHLEQKQLMISLYSSHVHSLKPCNFSLMYLHCNLMFVYFKERKLLKLKGKKEKGKLLNKWEWHSIKWPYKAVSKYWKEKMCQKWNLEYC